MSENRTWVRFFTIADYEEEEIWLRQQHRSGWKLSRLIVPCFYIFERCEPEDVVYRLDYRNNREDEEYLRLFEDYGWEVCGRCMGWLYFRKPAEQTDDRQEDEIFSDNASRVDMVDHIVRTRMLPLLTIFLCCLLPSWMRMFSGGIFNVLSYVLYALVLVYIWLIVYSGIKLTRLRKKYESQK